MLGILNVPIGIAIGLAIIVACLSGIAIANFFNISMDAYIPYLSWVVALGLFMILLPKNNGLVFLNKVK